MPIVLCYPYSTYAALHSPDYLNPSSHNSSTSQNLHLPAPSRSASPITMRLPATLLACLAATLISPTTAQTFTDCNPLDSTRCPPVPPYRCAFRINTPQVPVPPNEPWEDPSMSTSPRGRSTLSSPPAAPATTTPACPSAWRPRATPRSSCQLSTSCSAASL